MDATTTKQETYTFTVRLAEDIPAEPGRDQAVLPEGWGTLVSRGRHGLPVLRIPTAVGTVVLQHGDVVTLEIWHALRAALTALGAPPTRLL